MTLVVKCRFHKKLNFGRKGRNNRNDHYPLDGELPTVHVLAPQCIDLYWALGIIHILGFSTDFPRGHYDMCRQTIIATAHHYNIVPKFKVYFYYLMVNQL